MDFHFDNFNFLELVAATIMHDHGQTDRVSTHKKQWNLCCCCFEASFSCWCFRSSLACVAAESLLLVALPPLGEDGEISSFSC